MSGRIRLSRTFTLIELLVVIAIIAILAAMLMPALDRARAMAIQASCISNLRNVALAQHMYQNDNNGVAPPYMMIDFGSSPGNPASPYNQFVVDSDPDWDGVESFHGLPTIYGGATWKHFLYPYVGTYEMLGCPANAADRGVSTRVHEDDWGMDWWDGLLFEGPTYVANGWLYNNATAVDSVRTQGTLYVHPDRISNPAGAAQVLDGTHGGSMGNGTYVDHGAGSFDFLPGKFAVSAYDVSIQDMADAGGGWASLATYSFFFSGDIDAGRHPGPSVNTQYHDGHVDNRNITEIMPPDPNRTGARDPVYGQPHHYWAVDPQDYFGYGDEDSATSEFPQWY